MLEPQNDFSDIKHTTPSNSVEMFGLKENPYGLASTPPTTVSAMICHAFE